MLHLNGRPLSLRTELLPSCEGSRNTLEMRLLPYRYITFYDRYGMPLVLKKKLILDEVFDVFYIWIEGDLFITAVQHSPGLKSLRHCARDFGLHYDLLWDSSRQWRRQVRRPAIIEVANNQSISCSSSGFLSNTKKVEHITLVLKSLHWLPVCQHRAYYLSVKH